MNNTNYKVEESLLKTDGVVNYSKDKFVEVKPGIFSPIYINLKNTLPSYETRHFLVRKMSEIIGDEPDYICGIESGGTYYASAIADTLIRPVILYRKESKDYNDKRRLVGMTPTKGSTIAVVDDVFATGLTVSGVVSFFKELGCKVHLYSIFSYGYEKEIGEKLGVNVSSISNFKNLCAEALREKVFTHDDVEFLSNHVATYKDYLKNF